MRKLLAIVLVLQLFFAPGVTFAQGTAAELDKVQEEKGTVETESQTEKVLDENVAEETKPQPDEVLEEKGSVETNPQQEKWLEEKALAENEPKTEKQVEPKISEPNRPQSEKRLEAKEIEKFQPKKSLDIEKNYLDPSNYPLIGNEEYITTFIDTYDTYQYLFFDQVTTYPYSYDSMLVSLIYLSDYLYYKDTNLYIEYYQESAGSLYYYGYDYFDTSGYDAVYLDSIISKTDFIQQPYIYMRVGIANSPADAYYSGVTTFKVVNPFYQNDTPVTPDDSYAVISNESVDGDYTQPTGTFNLKNMKYTLDKSLTSDTYQVDLKKPFDSAANKDKLVRKGKNPISKAYAVGDSKYFWVADLQYGTDYQITARLAYSGTRANIWVNNNQITDSQAAALGKEFDNNIHPSVTNNFGAESDVNGDGKVNILTYDIQDGFSGSGGYVGGYFWSGDLYNVSYSNNSEIFYIDTYPAMGTGSTKDVTQAYDTIAHEFQHMVNFNRNVLIEGSSDMDVWLDEALAMAAEQVYTGQGLTNRVNYYNSSSSIENGHSLLYWDNYGDTLSNYSLSYLFGQYIKIQTGQGDRIFKEILNDPNSNYKAIENVAKKYINPNMTFGKLMTYFRIALLFKEPSGIYGFKGDPFFNALEEKIFTGNSQDLRGGGAVVTTFNSEDGFTIPTSKGPSVTYSTFKMEEGPGNVDLTPPPAPVVNTITNADTSVTGTTEAGATVKVYVGTQLLGSAKADTKGKFTVTIPAQNIGVKLLVTATDAAGNVSQAKEVTVTKAPPAAPKVNAVTQVDKVVTGTAITNSIVYVKVGSTVIGSGKTTPQGNFAVTIPAQPAGTKLGVIVRDAEGTFSAYSYVTVTKKPAPLAPTVNVITDKSTTVIGTAEKNSTVYVKVGSVVIGKGAPDVQGNFYIDIPAQKLGTKIGVVVRDAAGNYSPYTYVTVAEKTAPLAPKVFNITDKTTVVTGTAEINTTIYVKSGSVVLGSGKTDILGNFAITIPAQATGTKIGVVVRDTAGRYSPYTNLIVMEKTVPFAPAVNEVTDTATVVTGTAEANTTIYVKVGSTIIGRGKTNAEGNFSIVIPVQKAGTKLGVVVRDAEAKFSPYTYVTVVASK